MSATYAHSDFGDQTMHHRDGSLLKRKQEQWAEERASRESWFPFGSPGGGAPNKKDLTPTQPGKAVTTEQCHSSHRPNNDSEHWSESGNVCPSRDAELSANLANVPQGCPYVVASTSAVQSPMYFSQNPQVIIEKVPFQETLASVNLAAPVPVHFVYSSNGYGQAVPVDFQKQTNPARISYAFPVQVLPNSSVNCAAPTTSSCDTSESYSEPPKLSSSYTERWANQLPYWGFNAVRGEEQLKEPATEAPVCMSLPPVTGTQPLAVVRPVLIPLISSVRSRDQISPSHGFDETVRKSLTDSNTSLNSSGLRSVEYDGKVRANHLEHVLKEQVAEKRQIEAEREEQERAKSLAKEHERRMMEEEAKQKDREEGIRKKNAEEIRLRREAALAESLKKAKEEAALLRRARIFKHVLECSPKDDSLKHTLLGDDGNLTSKLLKEVESLDRQKKYDLYCLEKEKSLKEGRSGAGMSIDEGKESNRSKPSSRRHSFDDDRPIKGELFGTRNYDSCLSPFTNKSKIVPEFSRTGRQSMRANSTQKVEVRRRTGSADKSTYESSCMADELPCHRRSSSQCTVPVRLQKRIPPPPPRPKRISSEHRKASEPYESKDIPAQCSDTYRIIGSAAFTRGSQVDCLSDVSHVHIGTSQKPVICETRSVPVGRQYGDISVSSSRNDDTFVTNIGPADTSDNKFFAAAANPVSSAFRRSSVDALALLSEEKAVTKKRPTLPALEECILNPLFQPVATRCRRPKLVMGNSDVLLVGASTTSDSSSSPPAENESASPAAQNTPRKPFDAGGLGCSVTQVRPFNPSLDLPVISPPAAGNGVSECSSPFKKRLASTGVMSRHREEELLSPKIRSKGEFPISTRLRASMASLTVEDNDDGRASPVSPLLQSFSSKSLQYRSLNLKKETSEQNRKVLKQLAELRSQLRRKQAQLENTFSFPTKGSPLAHSRTSSSLNGVSNMREGSVTAV